MTEPKVKELVWAKRPTRVFAAWFANPGETAWEYVILRLGEERRYEPRFSVHPNGPTVRLDEERPFCRTLIDAKLACQRHLERTVLSLLELEGESNV